MIYDTEYLYRERMKYIDEYSELKT